MKTPQKHKELINAWADGAEIEFRELNTQWVVTELPMWCDHLKYRIKQEPQPDVVRYLSLWHHSGYSTQQPDSNLKVTFDIETGKLKLAEVI